MGSAMVSAKSCGMTYGHDLLSMLTTCLFDPIQFIPTPLAFVSWICTVRGWVFLQSLIMCGLYFAAAWVLRRVVWKFVAGAFENFISYNVLKVGRKKWNFGVHRSAFFAVGRAHSMNGSLSSRRDFTFRSGTAS